MVGSSASHVNLKAEVLQGGRVPPGSGTLPPSSPLSPRHGPGPGAAQEHAAACAGLCCWPQKPRGCLLGAAAAIPVHLVPPLEEGGLEGWARGTCLAWPLGKPGARFMNERLGGWREPLPHNPDPGCAGPPNGACCASAVTHPNV